MPMAMANNPKTIRSIIISVLYHVVFIKLSTDGSAMAGASVDYLVKNVNQIPISLGNRVNIIKEHILKKMFGPWNYFKISILLSVFVVLGIGTFIVRTIIVRNSSLQSTGIRTFSDADNGRKVLVGRNTELKITLGTTSWTFQPISNTSIVSQIGKTEVVPTKPCFPGMPCGTSSAQFMVRNIGEAKIIATRHYCGEARNCRPSNDTWVLTVIVQ